MKSSLLVWSSSKNEGYRLATSASIFLLRHDLSDTFVDVFSKLNWPMVQVSDQRESFCFFLVSESEWKEKRTRRLTRSEQKETRLNLTACSAIDNDRFCSTIDAVVCLYVCLSAQRDFRSKHEKLILVVDRRISTFVRFRYSRWNEWCQSSTTDHWNLVETGFWRFRRGQVKHRIPFKIFCLTNSFFSSVGFLMKWREKNRLNHWKIKSTEHFLFVRAVRSKVISFSASGKNELKRRTDRSNRFLFQRSSQSQSLHYQRQSRKFQFNLSNRR